MPLIFPTVLVSLLLVIIIINYQEVALQLGLTRRPHPHGRQGQSQDHREDPGGRDLNFQL